MPIIATVGRRSFAVSMLIGAMYVVLTAGGISMVYPFLLMLATATTTPGDMQEYRVIPRYYSDDNALYRKYLWLRYDTGIPSVAAKDYNRAYYGANASQFRLDEFFGWGDPNDRASKGRAIPPGIDPNDPDVRQRASDLDRFLKESAVLWPGPPLMETLARRQDGQTVKMRDYVRRDRDPEGPPLDPGGLSTGLGNMYRTVGYIGVIFTAGLSGPGRDQWPAFLRRLYADPGHPNEPEVEGLKRAIARHGRPYKFWRQVQPGYDMPTSTSWSIIEGEYVQSDWLFYKAFWLSGAPIVQAGAWDKAPAGRPSPTAGRPLGVLDHWAKQVGKEADAKTYTDVLGRTHRWTEAASLRSLRPTQLAPDFWRDLKDRHGSIEQFNLAIKLARLDRSSAEGGRQKALSTGRDVVLARTVDWTPLGGPAGAAEPRWAAALRAVLANGRGGEPSTDDPAQDRYLLPPQINSEWAKLTFVAGLGSTRLARLNEWIESAWVAGLKARNYRVVHLAPFKDFSEVHLSARRPIYQPLAVEWDLFVAAKVPTGMVQPIGQDPTSQPDDPGLVEPSRSVGDQALGEKTRPSFDPARNHLRLPDHAWRDFLGWLYAGDGAPLYRDKDAQAVSQRRAEFRRLYLPGKSAQDVAALVRGGQMLYGPEYDAFSLIVMPVAERDAVEFQAHKGELRRHFLFGNFKVVLDEMVLDGRAMFNTIVLIFLVIVCNITVNPLAAYALSRFRLTYTYKVLLFMLATMAFPPAVGMIPSFLLLKKFGMIDTYAALVLPGIASGYTIFLLKGFFDALPQELYEAAEIDGAGKITTFLNVTYPLSKPIFAIITLNAFTAAYSGFMWAFLICPDQNMWTIMVHLFIIQQNAGQQAGIAMASLVLAAIPTFLVFLFCQNVILRGIIIPSFK